MAFKIHFIFFFLILTSGIIGSSTNDQCSTSLGFCGNQLECQMMCKREAPEGKGTCYDAVCDCLHDCTASPPSPPPSRQCSTSLGFCGNQLECQMMCKREAPEGKGTCYDAVCDCLHDCTAPPPAPPPSRQCSTSLGFCGNQIECQMMCKREAPEGKGTCYDAVCDCLHDCTAPPPTTPPSPPMQ